jgi:hypothetical protein
LATGSFLSALVGLPSQQSQANEQIPIADGSFGVATATGTTGPTFAGRGDQHTEADAPGDGHQRFNKISVLDSSNATLMQKLLLQLFAKVAAYANIIIQIISYLFPRAWPQWFQPSRGITSIR